MNSKRANWLVFTVVALHIAISLGVGFTSWGENLDILANFALSAGLLLAPALVFLFAGRKEQSLNSCVGFHRIKFSAAALTVLFTFLLMPLTTVLNALSMLFVDNTVLGLSPQMLDKPFWMLFFCIAVMAPFAEEFLFRGVLYQSYRRKAGAHRAVLWSAALFALVHMNFNQGVYALVLGIFLALLAEATGSLWSSFLCHLVFNGWSVCLMFLTERLASPVELEPAAAGLPDQVMVLSMMIVISIFTVVAVGTTVLAVCVLKRIAVIQGRAQKLKEAVSFRKTEGGRIMSLPLLGAMVLAFGFMIIREM